MLKDGIITECDKSEFVSNLFMVDKKNAKDSLDMRPVVDYKELND